MTSQKSLSKQSQANKSKTTAQQYHVKRLTQKLPTQPCLRCGFTMGAIAGTKAAICRNCGYKDPCCE